MRSTYTTQATAVGGRTGSVASADGAFNARLDKPAALGGFGGPGTNPEQLFAGAYAACFLDALKRAAEEIGETLTGDSNVTVDVTLESDLDAAALAVAVAVDLPGQRHADAVVLACRAHELCPYSRILHGHLDVRVSVP